MREGNSQPPAPSLTSKQYINTTDIRFLCFSTSAALFWTAETLMGSLTKHSVSPPAALDFCVGELLLQTLTHHYMNTADSKCWVFNGLYTVVFTLRQSKRNASWLETGQFKSAEYLQKSGWWVWVTFSQLLWKAPRCWYMNACDPPSSSNRRMCSQSSFSVKSH